MTTERRLKKIDNIICSFSPYKLLNINLSLISVCASLYLGGAVAQSVERATPGEEVPSSIQLWPSAPYWLGRCQYNVTG